MKLGSAGLRTFAPIAMSAMKMMMTAPMSAGLWRRKRRHTVLRDGAVSSTTGTAPGVIGNDAAISVVLHARVEPGIAQVCDQVERDHEERREHHVAHQQREVELA